MSCFQAESSKQYHRSSWIQVVFIDILCVCECVCICSVILLALVSPCIELIKCKEDTLYGFIGIQEFRACLVRYFPLIKFVHVCEMANRRTELIVSVFWTKEFSSTATSGSEHIFFCPLLRRSGTLFFICLLHNKQQQQQQQQLQSWWCHPFRPSNSSDFPVFFFLFLLR